MLRDCRGISNACDYSGQQNWKRRSWQTTCKASLFNYVCQWDCKRWSGLDIWSIFIRLSTYLALGGLAGSSFPGPLILDHVGFCFETWDVTSDQNMESSCMQNVQGSIYTNGRGRNSMCCGNQYKRNRLEEGTSNLRSFESRNRTPKKRGSPHLGAAALPGVRGELWYRRPWERPHMLKRLRTSAVQCTTNFIFYNVLHGMNWQRELMRINVHLPSNNSTNSRNLHVWTAHHKANTPIEDGIISICYQWLFSSTSSHPSCQGFRTIYMSAFILTTTL